MAKAGVKFDKKTAKSIDILLRKSPKWLSQAINDTTRGLRTDISSDKVGVRQELNVKKKQVTSLIKLTPSKPNKLVGIVSVKGQPIPAYDKSKPWGGGDTKPTLHFQGKRNAGKKAKSKTTGKAIKGKAFKYSFKFKHNKGRKTLNSAFPAKMKSGHIGIFIRKKDKGIKEIFSSSVTDVLSNAPILNELMDETVKRMAKNIERQIQRIAKSGR